MRDYTHRGGRVLPDGGSSNERTLKVVEVSLVHLRLTVDGNEITIEEPNDFANVEGTWRVKYQGKATGDLNWDATSSTVQSAILGIDGLESGDVTVSGGPLDDAPLVITVVNTNLNASDFTVQYGKIKITGQQSFGVGEYEPGQRVSVAVLEFDADSEEFTRTNEGFFAHPVGPNWAVNLRGYVTKSGDSWLLQNMNYTLPCFTNDDLRDPPDIDGATDDTTDPGEFLGVYLQTYCGYGSTEFHAKLEEGVTLPAQESPLLGINGKAEMLAYPLNGVLVCTPMECYI